MTHLTLTSACLLAIAEMAGALCFFKSRSVRWQRLLSGFGLGFAIAIVLFDILPDSTEHFSMGYLLFAVAALLTFAVCRMIAHGSNFDASQVVASCAVGGMALHNLGEGQLLLSLSAPLSMLFYAGALLHKLPEGMATYALLKSRSENKRLVASLVVAIMIPCGALIHFSEEVQQPLMAVMAGIIFTSVGTSIFERFLKAEHKVTAAHIASYLAGGLIGGISCIIA